METENTNNPVHKKMGSLSILLIAMLITLAVARLSSKSGSYAGLCTIVLITMLGLMAFAITSKK